MNGVVYIACALAVIVGANGLKEEECVEVGFARMSYTVVQEGYEIAKETMVKKWAQEDKDGYPTYSQMLSRMKNLTRSSELLEEASKEILKKIRKTRVGKRCAEEYILAGIEKHVTPLMQMDKEFAEELGLVMSFQCLVGSPYPNVDGTCVNEESPDLGGIGAKFLRLMPPVAGKGGFSLRGSRNPDKSLPTGRDVSRLIKRFLVRPEVSRLFVDFGHFIARDSFSIPEAPITEGVDCCKTPDKADCEPIFIKENDSLFKTFKCINYKRSAQAQAILGHREAFSSVSTFFDATPVYGATNEEAFTYKTSYFGYIKSPEPLEEEDRFKKGNCRFPQTFKDCFHLDNEVEYIEDFDLILTLEHNKIADMLAAINPHFDDSLLYNEARRIVIAEYNNILYGEFLPVLMGNATVEKHSLRPGADGHAGVFLAEVNPGILTSYALAASRNPAMLTEWRRDWGQTNILSSNHYESVRGDAHQDLLAMDVQRGRDHGLAGYERWRGFCENGKHIGSWQDYEDLISKDAVKELKELYEDEISDVDLMVALLETPDEGAVVGKTINCILADQFARLKSGNRLYWEFETSMMSGDQKGAIRTMNAAGLLCRHLSVHAVPTNPFRPSSESNPLIECKKLPQLDLTHWKDTSLIEVMEKAKADELKLKVGGVTSNDKDSNDRLASIEPVKIADADTPSESPETEALPTENSKSEVPTSSKVMKKPAEKPDDKAKEAEIEYDNKTKDPNAKREEIVATKIPTKEEL